MKKAILTMMIMSAAVMGLFAMGGGESSGAALSGEFQLGGSTTVEPIATSAIEGFEEKYPEVKAAYEGTGSSVGVQGALDGTYLLGGASRNLKPEEKEKGALALPIALDGIAVVVNGGVNVDNLTAAQLKSIFKGEITNWKEVGGADAVINVVNRDEASGTRAAFAKLALDKEAFIADAITTASNGNMVTKVGSTPSAIGYCGLGYVEQARNAGAKAVMIGGAEPTKENVLNNSYPISRKLNIVYTGSLDDHPFKKAFTDYLLSPEGQDIVADNGFIKLP